MTTFALRLMASFLLFSQAPATSYNLTLGFHHRMFGRHMPMHGWKVECKFASFAAVQTAADRGVVGATYSPDWCISNGLCHSCSGGAAVRKHYWSAMRARFNNTIVASLGAHFFGDTFHAVFNSTFAAQFQDIFDVLGVDNGEFFGTNLSAIDFAKQVSRLSFVVVCGRCLLNILYLNVCFSLTLSCSPSFSSSLTKQHETPTHPHTHTHTYTPGRWHAGPR